MSVRVGINGFGRIGRLVFRAAQNKDVEIVGINDLTDAATLAHLLKWDSIHGRFPGTVEAGDNAIIVDGVSIPICSERDPANLPWSKLGAAIVLESRSGSARRLPSFLPATEFNLCQLRKKSLR